MRSRRAVLLIPSLRNPIPFYQTANPCICHTSEKSPVTLITATLPKTPFRKSFVCHTYETPQGVVRITPNTCEQRGKGAPTYAPPLLPVQLSNFDRRPPTVSRTLFQVPYVVSSLFSTLTETAGVYLLSSHCGTDHRIVLTLRTSDAL